VLLLRGKPSVYFFQFKFRYRTHPYVNIEDCSLTAVQFIFSATLVGQLPHIFRQVRRSRICTGG